ncbi:hypothetical protein ACFO3I_02760 [Rheinheimera marina]|uniref:Uncharacterized protein n=1 Tax=Rheinheimera marina TaxID=1774958 RepID=A0ABV9JI08_9GAMM
MALIDKGVQKDKGLAYAPLAFDKPEQLPSGIDRVVYINQIFPIGCIASLSKSLNLRVREGRGTGIWAGEANTLISDIS